MRSKKRLLADTAAATFLFLAAAVGLGRWHEASSLLHPSREYDYSPSEFGLKPEEQFFLSGGERIHGWFFRGKPATPTIFYLQGNAGTSANRLGAIRGYVESGLNVFIYEPRGFGQSEGMAARDSFIEDASVAYNHLVNVLKVPPEKVIILGQSLGGVPALRLANSVQCRGLILEGTILSVRQVAKDFYPNAPIWVLASSDFDNSAQIRKLKVPVLIIVGGKDDVVAPYHSRELFALAPEPKQILEIPDGRHTDLFKVEAERYYGAITKFAGL